MRNSAFLFATNIFCSVKLKDCEKVLRLNDKFEEGQTAACDNKFRFFICSKNMLRSKNQAHWKNAAPQKNVLKSKEKVKIHGKAKKHYLLPCKKI